MGDPRGEVAFERAFGGVISRSVLGLPMDLQNSLPSAPFKTRADVLRELKESEEVF